MLGGLPLAALILGAALLLPPAAGAADEGAGELCVLDAAGAVAGAWPLEEGQGFAIRYTHSVALTPVEDHFLIRDGIIHLDKTVYQDFGAGLPSVPEPGQRMSTGDGRIVMSGYARPLESFDVRVGRVAGHTLLLPPGAGRPETPLPELAPAGSALTFTYAPHGCGSRAKRP
ncbi:MAG: DUF1850 domain-containing protein [Desulfovibrio sp.]|nr:DUF1850 domain-containing protein [Desulfovibrio sp.]